MVTAVCSHRGTCVTVTNICIYFLHFLTEGCPGGCSGHGDCRLFSQGYMCNCHSGWKGKACDLTKELMCNDGEDNDRGLLFFVVHVIRQDV